MKKTTKQTAITISLFCITVILGSHFLFEKKEHEQTEVKAAREQISHLKSNIKTIEKSYHTAIGEWEGRNDSLQNHIQNTKAALERARKQAGDLKEKILNLVSEDKIVNDTIAIISSCDSLKTQVSRFITATAIRDSLCDEEIHALKNVMGNKDSIIAIGEQSFQSLKQSAELSLAQQMELTGKLALADKKIKRGKTKTKALSAAVMVLSGVTATLLLSR